MESLLYIVMVSLLRETVGVSAVDGSGDCLSGLSFMKRGDKGASEDLIKDVVHHQAWLAGFVSLLS